MDNRIENNELFRRSHITILISFTAFAMVLCTEAIILGWEKWALILVAAGVGSGWFLHIRQLMTAKARLWTYSVMMMVIFYFYGIHLTSAYDIALVMTVVIMIYTMTGIKALITFCQIVYYVTFATDIIQMVKMGESFDILMITRSMLHVGMITMAAWLGRTIIKRWDRVLMVSRNEIEALEEGTGRLNQFLINISHEIRTPINAIIGLTDASVDKEQDEEIRANLISVSKAGRRIGDQIGDILDYSEIDMNQLVLNPEPCELGSVMEDLVTEFRASKPQDTELIIDMDPRFPSVIRTDSVKVKKVIRHLITNALKVVKDGGVYVRVWTMENPTGVNLCIDVVDTGIGMNRKEVERVKDRFYQANNEWTKNAGGLGLGLSIVMGFVRTMDGFVTMESKPNVGTRVHVTIPVEVIDSTPSFALDNTDEMELALCLNYEMVKSPAVREFYNAAIKNLAKGMNVKAHLVDDTAKLRDITTKVNLTHLIIGEGDYIRDAEYLEKLAEKVMVVAVVEDRFKPRKDSNVRRLYKPYYGLGLINLLKRKPERLTREIKLYCPEVHALVVDDESLNLTVVKRIFQRYGIRVSTALSGSEAIQMCHHVTYDIIFMDHMMPGMDGVEAMRGIRRIMGASAHVPIVALTANAVSSAKEMFLREGFDGFVSKPIETVELERMLRKLLPEEKLQEWVNETEETVDSEESSATAADGSTGDAISAGKGTSAETETGSAKEAPKAPDDRRSPEEQLKTYGIDAARGLEYSQNDQEFYIEVLQQYASEAEDKAAHLEEDIEKKDMADYAIYVHAIKSTSKMIGASRLSRMAQTLEGMAKDGKVDAVIADHQEMLNLYLETAEAIQRIYPTEGSETTESVGAEADMGDDEVLDFMPEGGEAE